MGHRKGRYPPDDLALHLQGLPAGRQDPQVCARIQERICKMGHRVCKVLAVIQDQRSGFLCRASVSVSMSGRPGCSRTFIARATA